VTRRSDEETAELPQFSDRLSLTLENACERTDFNETQMRRFIREKRVRSFKLGKRRYIEVASLRRLIEELTAADGATRPQLSRGKRGRWLGLAEPSAEKA
jgi:hypothetical protein